MQEGVINFLEVFFIKDRIMVAISQEEEAFGKIILVTTTGLGVNSTQELVM